MLDITDVEAAKLLASVTGRAGQYRGPHLHAVTRRPVCVTVEPSYQYAPMRVFDLKPALDGTAKTISRPIGAWTADWKALST